MRSENKSAAKFVLPPWKFYESYVPISRTDLKSVISLSIRSLSEMIVVEREDAMKWLDVSIPMIFQLDFSRYEKIITM